MRRRAALALVLATGCHPPRPVPAEVTPAPGITMAFYRTAGTSYTVVDDRRLVEVRGGVLELDHVDPGAALPSLVIEPLGGSPLVIGQCDRAHETRALPPETALERFGAWQERRAKMQAEGEVLAEPQAGPEATETVVSPVVRCAVTGATGKQLVRVLYVSSQLGYRAQHDVRMTSPDRVTVETKFSISTPAWSDRAEVVLYEGLPGGDRPAVEVARGQLVLDGSTGVIGAPAREVPARIRRVFDGAIRSGVGNADEPSWGRDSVHAVWVWLELERTTLAPGLTHAYLALAGERPRDIDVPAAGREETRTGSRLPLWIDPDLRGVRNRIVTGADGTSPVDRFSVSVSNVGGEPRDVWVEEKLRPAKRRTVVNGWPAKPALGADSVRTKVTVKPGGTERVTYTVAYVF